MKSLTKFMDSFGAILLAVIWIAPLLFAFWAATHSTSDAVNLNLFSPWTLDNFRVAWDGAPWLKYFSLALVCIMEVSCFLRSYKVSLSMIIELTLCIYILFRIFLSHHLRRAVGLTRHVNLLKYYSLWKMIAYIIGLNYMQFSKQRFEDMNLDNYLADLCMGVPNEALLYSFSIYFGCCIFSWTSKFRDHLSHLRPRPKRKFLSHQPYRKMFYKIFAPNLPTIIGISDRRLGKHLTFSLDLKWSFYKELASLKWFVKIFRNSIRRRVVEQQLNLGLFFKANTFLWKYFGVFKLYKYAILQFLLTLGMIVMLSLDSYSLNIISICNMFASIMLMLFDSYILLFWAMLLLCFLPHLFIAVIYLISLYCKNIIFSPISFQQDLAVLLSRLGLTQDKEHFQTSLILHVSYSLAALLFLICFRVLHNRAKQRKVKNQLQHIRLYKLRVHALDEDGLFLLSRLVVTLLTAMKYYLIFKYLTEALQFVSISNGLILLSLFFYLWLSPHGLNIVCGVVLSIFLLRFFSRYSTFFGFLENHFNLLYGFYFNHKDSFFSEIVMDLNDSPFQVFQYNFFRLYFLVSIKKCLHRFYARESNPPRRKQRRLLFKTKVLATIYNTCTELFSHCKNIINTTKIFFVYFSIYYFAYVYYTQQFAAVEICYCSFLLLFHLLLFQKKRHTANKAFASFFAVYYLFILGLFASSYISRLSIYDHSSYFNSEDVDFQQIFEENYNIMVPLCVKLVLGTISIGALYQDFKDVKSKKQMSYRRKAFVKDNL